MNFLFQLVPGTIRRSASVCGITFVAATFLMGCREEKPLTNSAPTVDFVATVGGATISRDELAEALAKRAKSLGGEPAAALKQQVLDELIREKVLLSKARAAGVDRDPELVRRWERMVVAKYEAAHKPDAEKQRAPTTAEVEQFYREHAAEYQQPDRIRVALIQVKSSAKATEEKRGAARAGGEGLPSRRLRAQTSLSSPGCIPRIARRAIPAATADGWSAEKRRRRGRRSWRTQLSPWKQRAASRRSSKRVEASMSSN